MQPSAAQQQGQPTYEALAEFLAQSPAFASKMPDEQTQEMHAVLQGRPIMPLVELLASRGVRAFAQVRRPPPNTPSSSPADSASPP
jgi:hypothetical protein